MNYHVPLLETRPARLAAMPKLPVFLDLKARRVLLIGNGEGIAWKVELLAASGAHIAVCASSPCEELKAILDSDPRIVHLPRAWREEDFDDTWVVIAEGPDDDDVAQISAAARARGALVNIIDQPAFCDFQFGTIVNRAPVLIGISTDGAAPILGQAIRRRIEAILPRSIGAWAKAAKAFRGDLPQRLPTREGRRRFWERFVDLTFISQAEEDAQLERLEGLVRQIIAEKEQPRAGEVIIVGAGPGDPELLTMKAVRELQAADVIVYDRLVSNEILELGRREARRIFAGKKGHGPSCRQEEISALVVRLAREGKRVVRLKGGDPAIFARTQEEVHAYREAGLSVRIIPGITAATAAAAALGTSLTVRGKAQRVHFVTGHDLHGQIPADIDAALDIDPSATTIVYMGGRHASELARRMIARGAAPTTPVVIAQNVSRANMNSNATTLSALARSNGIGDSEAPTLLIIGEAANAAVIPESAEMHAESLVA